MFQKKMRKASLLTTKIGLVSAMALSVFYSPVIANTDSVQVDADSDSILISNDFMGREFSIQDGKIQTNGIYNYILNDKNIVFNENSEDFIISTVKEKEESNKIDIRNNSVSRTLCNASGTNFSQSAVDTLFDNNTDSYIDNWQINGNPFYLTIDFGDAKEIGAMSVNKRPGVKDNPSDPNNLTNGTNGTMGRYELQKSDDGATWTTFKEGEFTAKDWNLHVDEEKGIKNVGDTVYVNFDEVIQTQYIRIIQHSAPTDGVFKPSIQEFTSSEISLYRGEYKEEEVEQENLILSSDLEYDSYSVSDVVDEENIKGKQLTIAYKPYLYEGVNYEIKENFVLKEGKHYMQSFLEINVDDKEKATIDYIELDNIAVDSSYEGVWSKPDDAAISSMYLDQHEVGLGQPIYMNSFFFGSEFPAAETDIVKDKTQIRYYSGKNFATLEAEEALEEDCTFTTWNNVVGVAANTDESVVRNALFSYIKDIAVTTKFRRQYNSWYDNMMGISDTSIASSFYGIEKGLSQNGVKPIDSYVVDDGWNQYPWMGENKTGFWEFNEKFPNELYTSSELASKFNSNFGLWVGPQGGFGRPNEFGHFLEERGTGYVQQIEKGLWNHQVICTGSKKYLNNFTTRFLDYQKRFDINYWKWDGFAMSPCSNPNHDHITGGLNDMYYNTEKWERWITIFELFRAQRAEEGKDLWINATNHVNLSPWLLQWINTVWVQDSDDTNQAGDGSAARHQRKIYYRDQVYYTLSQKNQFQFPFKNIYNHDPIYGVSDGSNATTNVFREFLFDNAMRGTAFWELYYSPSIMNEEKWMVTADALDFAETNHDVLENAKLFVEDGKTPTNGVYGYSAWNNEKGFVSFVNPTSTEKTYTLPLTDIYGVPTNMRDLTKAEVYPYTAETDGTTVSYGDDLTVTLAPFSSQIYQFGIDDTTAPEVVSAKIIETDKVRVRFNERINADAQFTIDGNDIEATLLADYRTVEFTVEGLADTAEVNITGLKDVYGNEAEEITLNVRKDEVVTVDTKDDLNGAVEQVDANGKKFVHLNNETFTLTEDGIEGTSDFSISMGINTTENNVTLLSQKDGFTLRIDNDGYLVFDVLGQSVSSKEEVTTVIEKAHGTINTPEYAATSTEMNTIGKINDGKTHTINAVREPNGVIKVYVDGKLSASTYNKNRVNENIVSNPIVLGSDRFEGYLADIRVENSAVYYNDAADYYNTFNLATEDDQLNRSEWVATACSQHTANVGTGSDGAAMDVLDGRDNTYWHSNYNGGDPCNDGKHWMKVDFGKQTSFEALEYTARPGAANGTWQKASVYGINEDGSEVELLKDQTITLKDNKYKFVFEEAQTFYGVKFVFEGKNGFGSAAEIKGFMKKTYASVEEINTLKQYAKDLLASISPEDYPKDHYNAFKEACNEILEISPFGNVEKKELETLRNTLDKKYNDLLKGINKDGLEKAIVIAEEELQKDYTKDSLYCLEKQLNLAKEVFNDEEAVQSSIDYAEELLKKAISELVVNIPETVTVAPGEIEGEWRLINGYRATDSTGSGKLSYTFTGKAIKALTVKGTDHGIMKVIITNKDGEEVYNEQLNTYASSRQVGAVLFEKELPYDTYTVTFEKNDANGTWVEVGALTITQRDSDEIDRSGLVEELAIKDTLNEEDYTVESWNAYVEAFNKAEAVNAKTDDETCNAEIEDVLKDLQAVRNNLEKLVYTVTVNGEEVYTGAYNDKVTVTAPVVEGKTFTAWLFDGKVISTDETYTFFLSEDMELVASYEEVNVEAQAILTNTILTKRDTKADIKFVAQLVVPTGYTVKDAGLVWSSKEDTVLSLENTNLKPTYITRISNTNQFSVTIKGMPAGRFIRGRIFATLVDSEGNETVVYSEEARVVNK